MRRTHFCVPHTLPPPPPITSLLLRGITFFATGAHYDCRASVPDVAPLLSAHPLLGWTQTRQQVRIVLGVALGITKREAEMIKGSQLIGRAVIDMEAAERLGKIKEIIVQRDGERVAGFIVVHGETIVGTGGKRRMIPASAVYSIGPDAMTVRGSSMQELAELDNLPRMSDIIGHKMVTQSGRLLGVIDDMLINGSDGTIVGFV